MVLQQLKRVVVQLSMQPATGSGRSVKEFLCRASAPKARAANPELQVEVRNGVKVEPYVEVEYKNGQTDRIPTAQLTCQQILDRINSISSEMATQQLLKQAGVSASSRLESGWQGGAGGERRVGRAIKVATS